MAEVEDYLQEGFDPSKVTVPRLRSILVTHNVEYPATSKKNQLIDLVEEHVLSQAPQLRAQRARAKRSSMGIVNAGSPEDNGLWDDYDLPPPPQSTKRSKSPRKASTRVKQEDHVPSTPATHQSPTKRGTRSVSRALSHADDHDAVAYEAPQSVRRSRRTVTPQIKPEPEEDNEDSVFTYDNPFQSGSSPAATKTPTNRRRTTGNEVVKSAKLSSRPSSRRRTDNYQEDYHNNYQDDFEDTPRPLQYRPITPDLLEPGEEFTPDAQLELEEAASRGEAQLAEPRKRSRQAAKETSFTLPLTVLFMAILGAYLAWYRQEKIAVGYCEAGRPAKSLFPPEAPVPDFLKSYVEPQCVPCPPHAFCYQEMRLGCKEGFVQKDHPLSLKGLIPLPPTCEPDGEKARRVQAVADRAIEELRTRRAQFECGDAMTEGGKVPDSPVIPEQELKETVSRKRAKRLNKEEFDDLWAAAIGEVTERDEIEVVATEASVIDPTDRPVPPIFQTEGYRPRLSLAFRSPARSGAPSDSAWQDIDSQLDF